MTISRKFISLYCVGLLVSAAAVAHATTVTFDTPAGASVKGGAVDATATVTTGAGTVTITLQDLLESPKDVGQLISDFDFVLSDGLTTGTLSTSSGQQISIAKGGSVTVG